MTTDFERKLDLYAEVLVKIGLALRAGQKLLIGAPTGLRLVPLELAPLVQKVARQAYQAGARYVDVQWGDEELQIIRLQNAPRDSFDEFPHWRVEGTVKHIKEGGAMLVLHAQDPDLLAEQDSDLVGQVQQTTVKSAYPVSELISRSAINWLVASAPVPGWAAKIFPDLPAEEQQARLWEVIFDVCRVNTPDPLAAWEAHLIDLAARSAYLNGKRYDALRYSGPGTDLILGLPAGQVWHSGRMTAENGVAFTANVPTEEVFTLPHKLRAEGVVTATKPLPYGGRLIEDFSLTFAEGKVVGVQARRNQAILEKLLDTDEGARRLGEVALVPHSSPISQSGLLFYNILYDENAANHIALGRAYAFSVEGGEGMTAQQFAAAGGNSSMIHVDFMIGSGAMDIDGLAADGTAEPVMRGGEWAFDV